MKLAFLFDIYTEDVTNFRQRIEELANEFGARMIHVEMSKGPIRLVCAEEDKYPPAHTPDGPVPKGRGVNDAEGNGHRGLGNHDHPRGGSARHPRGCLSVVDSASEQLQQRHEQELHGGGVGAASADSDRGGCAPCVRVCVPSDVSLAQGEAPRLITHPPTAPYLTYYLGGREPSFPGGAT